MLVSRSAEVEGEEYAEVEDEECAVAEDEECKRIRADTFGVCERSAAKWSKYWYLRGW